MNRFSAAILLFWIALLPGYSQTARELWNQYRGLALEKKWNEVASGLRPHLLPPPEDTLAPWLLQLYAQACFESGDVRSAMLSSEKVLKQYPRYSCKADVRFLFGQCHFRSRNWHAAFWQWIAVDAGYHPLLEGWLSSKVLQIPTDTLTVLQAQLQTEKPALAAILDRLKVSTLVQKAESRPLKVGLVLPVDLKKIHQTGQENSAVEFYKGFSLAAEVLAATDSALELSTFDIAGKPEKLQSLLQSGSLNNLDVWVGPVKSSFLNQLESKAANEKIPLFNPLAMGNDTKGPTWFTEPSVNTLAEQVLALAATRSSGKRVAILFGTEKQDSLLADRYRQLVRSRGREVVLFKKVGKNSAANLTKFLTEAGLDSTDHLFAANSEPMVRFHLPGAYAWIQAKYPVLIYGSWLESAQADLDEWSRQKFIFVQPDLIHLESARRAEWESNYLAKWASPPGWIAWKGFDLAFFLARQWYGWGKSGLAHPEARGGISSDLFGEYRFSNSRSDNQYVPAFQLSENRLIRIWPLAE